MLFKLLFGLSIIGVLAIGSVLAINSALSVDDLALCPNGIDPASARCQKVDAIVAISGGDTSARTETAIDLYRLGWSDELVFSGAAADPGSPSNAAVMKKQAMDEGVPDASIITDDYSTTTSGNAGDLGMIAKLHNLKRIIVVTSPYHQRRASLEFQKALPDVTVLSHPTPNDRNWPPNSWWLHPYSWVLAVTELVKLGFVKVAGA